MKNEPGIVYNKHFIVCLAQIFPTLGPTYAAISVTMRKIYSKALFAPSESKERSKKCENDQI